MEPTNDMGMTIGFMGLGKLGLPVALAIESKGYRVLGYDPNPAIATYLEERKIPFVEKDLQPLLDETKLGLASVDVLVEQCSMIQIAVQTPHRPQFEGATRIPEERADFDYTYLKEAVASVAKAAAEQKKKTTVVVISTCLPGTFNREIKPLLNEYIDYVYSPQFIAMGTVLDNYLNPEFVLLGAEHSLKNHPVKWFFESLYDKPFVETDITTAEAIKVSYNTFITMKTVLGNTWGELCHKLGANVDDLYKAWGLATDRLISPKYLRAGVGDGGGCHPRDNIALSYIAKEIGLSHNLFEDLMASREQHMAWLASLAYAKAQRYGLSIIILGRSFKPETNIETGSPAMLLENILQEVYGYSPLHPGEVEVHEKPIVQAVYIIGTQHDRYKDFVFPTGSVVIDPFRYIPNQPGVQIIRIGGKM